VSYPSTIRRTLGWPALRIRQSGKPGFPVTSRDTLSSPARRITRPQQSPKSAKLLSQQASDVTQLS
jgi:hypothetical protein